MSQSCFDLSKLMLFAYRGPHQLCMWLSFYCTGLSSGKRPQKNPTLLPLEDLGAEDLVRSKANMLWTILRCHSVHSGSACEHHITAQTGKIRSKINIWHQKYDHRVLRVRLLAVKLFFKWRLNVGGYRAKICKSYFSSYFSIQYKRKTNTHTWGLLSLWKVQNDCCRVFMA